MGIGKTDNYKFYEGYEDEPEVEISADNMETLHIWDGFFEDIFGEPTPDGKGGRGFLIPDKAQKNNCEEIKVTVF